MSGANRGARGVVPSQGAGMSGLTIAGGRDTLFTMQVEGEAEEEPETASETVRALEATEAAR